MSQQPGLRFDIYERIMLSDDAESIRELDAVELIPHIEVVVEGEQAVLNGYLQLEGSYACVDESRSSVPLQHMIPVEITLPMNRVSSVDEIAVEIEHFDVDLLSSRSLNVTGVLSLQGIEMYTSTPSSDWREDEVLFIHEAEPEAAEQLEQEELDDEATNSAAPWLLRVPAAAYQHNEANGALTEPPPAYEPEEEQQPVFEAAVQGNEYEAQQVYTTSVAQPAVYQSVERVREEEAAIVTAAPKPREEIVVDTYEDLTLLDHYDTVTEQENEDKDKDSWIKVETEQNSDEDVEGDRDLELKIAFGSKRSEESQSSEFKSYLHKNDNYRTAANYPSSKIDDNRIAAEEQSPADVLEWKKLFLSESEEQKFKKVKMVIVQKEETLETIAKRYDRKPQEIKLYNRLQELDVSTGQVIYIP
ncbi:MAG: peptidoglycan-binding protein LysM [Paenibacillus sp.]|nr:peptidoglycan-binding protein LysM [Paenibacillus sp.]